MLKMCDYVILPDGRYGFITNDNVEVEVALGNSQDGTETISIPMCELRSIP